MAQENLRIAVAGGGSWGTALAHLLAGKGHAVTLWMRDAETAEAVNTRHENPRRLPGRILHSALVAATDMSVFAEQEVTLLAVPCRNMRAFFVAAAGHFRQHPVLVNASKGFDPTSLLPISCLVREVLHSLAPRYVALSGPSFAEEVMAGRPTAVVLASEDATLCRRLCHAFSTSNFRCYAGTDVLGTEFGGAVKNVMAIAAGLCDGLGLGHNSRAALITRGLAEISRLGEALGARPATFMGLSGLGDLVLTCTGDLSRNRRVGLALAEGGKTEDIVRTLGAAAEGVDSTFSVYAAARGHGIETPVIDVVYAILRGDQTPEQAIRALMLRELKDEAV